MKKNNSSKPAKQSKMPIKPLGDRVIIKELNPLERGEKTASGIIIPETADKDSGTRRGTVVAVGPGKYDDGKLVPVSVLVGESVLFQWGEKVKIDGEEYYVVRESEIVGIVK